MNNLHRELAPVSTAAWAEIEAEATRTLKRNLAARRVVDMVGPSGLGLAAVGTGHVEPITPPAEGVQSVRREVRTLVELRVTDLVRRQLTQALIGQAIGVVLAPRPAAVGADQPLEDHLVLTVAQRA